jgi:hypothetical protein
MHKPSGCIKRSTVPEFKITHQDGTEHRVLALRVVQEGGNVVFSDAVRGIWSEVASFPCDDVVHISRPVIEYTASTRWADVTAPARVEGVERPAAFT